MKTIQKLASLISWLGHPLFTAAAVVTVTAFKLLAVRTAIICSAVMLVGVIIPVNVFTYQRVKKGTYSNFDISVKEHRSSFYLFLLILFAIATAILYYTGQRNAFTRGCFTAGLLLLSAACINPFLKVSLHAALSLYFCFCLLPLYPRYATLLFIVAGLISISRLILKRHTFSEVLTGNLLGAFYGAIMLIVLQ